MCGLMGAQKARPWHELPVEPKAGSPGLEPQRVLGFHTSAASRWARGALRQEGSRGPGAKADGEKRSDLGCGQRAEKACRPWGYRVVWGALPHPDVCHNIKAGFVVASSHGKNLYQCQEVMEG